MCTGDHPFYSRNRKAIQHNILRKKLALPSWLEPATHKFLKVLAHKKQHPPVGPPQGHTPPESFSRSSHHLLEMQL